jgi:hypothetical protein
MTSEILPHNNLFQCRKPELNTFPFLHAAGRCDIYKYLLIGFQQRARDFLAPKAAGFACLGQI